LTTQTHPHPPTTGLRSTTPEGTAEPAPPPTRGSRTSAGAWASAGVQTSLQDARVHCAVLKQRPVTPTTPTTRPHHRPDLTAEQTMSDVTGTEALRQRQPPGTPHPRTYRPVPSGPNSVPTTGTPTPPRSPPPQKGRY